MEGLCTRESRGVVSKRRLRHTRGSQKRALLRRGSIAPSFTGTCASGAKTPIPESGPGIFGRGRIGSPTSTSRSASSRIRSGTVTTDELQAALDRAEGKRRELERQQPAAKQAAELYRRQVAQPLESGEKRSASDGHAIALKNAPLAGWSGIFIPSRKILISRRRAHGREGNPAVITLRRAICEEFPPGVPSPGAAWRRKTRRTDAKWLSSAIHGDPKRNSGILNCTTYIGQVSWNRRHMKKRPGTSKRVAVIRIASDLITHDDPALRIVSDERWQRVKDRQAMKPATAGRAL
jgi:Recombinase